jgi:hypothetical protein
MFGQQRIPGFVNKFSIHLTLINLLEQRLTDLSALEINRQTWETQD